VPLSYCNEKSTIGREKASYSFLVSGEDGENAGAEFLSWWYAGVAKGRVMDRVVAVAVLGMDNQGC
jgi:hypothetical protein